MSGHLIGCAGLTDLPTSHKLALVAFSDSADDRTHIGFPGYEGVMQWACCSRGRAAELIRDLVDWGYLKHHKRGRRGQRAEYVVFPGGCCDLHRLPVEEPAVDVDALAQAAGVTVEQARQMLAAMGDTLPPAPASTSTEIGSDAPDAMTGNGSSAPDPNDAEQTQPVENTPAEAGKGPDSVHDSRSTANAFTPSSNPPSPTGKPAGVTCAKHPNGHPNCRGCGTTARQKAKAAKTAAAAPAARRRESQLRAEQARRAAETATPETREAAMQRLRAEQDAVNAKKTLTGARR
jgi:hypothetical protein